MNRGTRIATKLQSRSHPPCFAANPGRHDRTAIPRLAGRRSMKISWPMVVKTGTATAGPASERYRKPVDSTRGMVRTHSTVDTAVSVTHSATFALAMATYRLEIAAGGAADRIKSPPAMAGGRASHLERPTARRGRRMTGAPKPSVTPRRSDIRRRKSSSLSPRPTTAMLRKTAAGRRMSTRSVMAFGSTWCPISRNGQVTGACVAQESLRGHQGPRHVGVPVPRERAVVVRSERLRPFCSFRRCGFVAPGEHDYIGTRLRATS